MLVQSKFLTNIIEKLNGEFTEEVIFTFDKLRKLITDPKNVILYCAGNLDILRNVEKPLKNIIPEDVILTEKQAKY